MNWSTPPSTLDAVPFPRPGGETGSDLYIRQDRFHDVFAADVAPEVAELMAATQRPIAASALEDTATSPLTAVVVNVACGEIAD